MEVPHLATSSPLLCHKICKYWHGLESGQLSFCQLWKKKISRSSSPLLYRFRLCQFANLPICFICNSTWTLRTGDKELQLGCEISEGLFSCALSNPRLSFKARFDWVEFKVAWKPFASLSLHSLNQDCICYNNISSVGVGIQLHQKKWIRLFA